MKNWLKYCLIGIVIIIILFFYIRQDDYDESKEEDLGISNYVEYVEACEEVKDVPLENRSQRLRLCPPHPGEENLTKLKLIEDIKGIILCDEPVCEIEDFNSGCQIIWSLSYKTYSAIGKPVYNALVIYGCGNKQYLLRGSSPPPHDKIARIQLNKEIINK